MKTNKYNTDLHMKNTLLLKFNNNIKQQEITYTTDITEIHY